MFKQEYIKTICLSVVLGTSGLLAQFPIDLMTNKTLGLGANLTMRGQNITNAQIPSRESIQNIRLGYAPASFLMITAGLGFDKFSVDNHEGREFNGQHGFSPSLSLMLASPKFMADKLSLEGGFDVAYMSSEDDNDYVYSAAIFNPFAGFKIHPSAFVDINLGARIHVVDGNMRDPVQPNLTYFANGQNIRLYTALTLKSPYEKVFFRADFDASPDVAEDWSNGPNEASLGFSIGMLLSWKERKIPTPERIYFSSYPEIKKVQDQIAEELE